MCKSEWIHNHNMSQMDSMQAWSDGYKGILNLLKQQPMREVIRIDQEEKCCDKPIEFTHVLTTHTGWRPDTILKVGHASLTYLGHCFTDGDIFMERTRRGNINIYKGHLNSGKY